MTIKSAYTRNHPQRLLLLVLEVHGIHSLARAAHGSSSWWIIQSFVLDFVTRPFLHQSKIEELGDKFQLQRGVDRRRAVGMGSWGRWVASLVPWAAQVASEPRSGAICCFIPSSSFLDRDLAKFNQLIKSKMTKKDKAKNLTGWCLISPRSLFLQQPTIQLHNSDAAAALVVGPTF